METTPVKYTTVTHPKEDKLQAWDVMKPFIRFGFKAMKIVGKASIDIIKLLPELLSESKRPTRR